MRRRKRERVRSASQKIFPKHPTKSTNAVNIDKEKAEIGKCAVCQEHHTYWRRVSKAEVPLDRMTSCPEWQWPSWPLLSEQRSCTLSLFVPITLPGDTAIRRRSPGWWRRALQYVWGCIILSCIVPMLAESHQYCTILSTCSIINHHT